MECPTLEALRGAAYAVYARPEHVLANLERARLLALLSGEERERYARFRFPQDADIFLVAHALTRCLLARALGAGHAAASLCFEVSAHGRPELSGPAATSGVRFNLSHTRGLVACALSVGSDIGVDVEEVGRRVELLGVAERVFSARELLELKALAGAAQRQRFFELWTLKEAYVKAIGKGLGAPLQAISFFPAGADPVPVHFAPEAADRAPEWCFRRHSPAPAFQLAVALRAGASAAVSFHELEPSELTV